jgi:uncharacterized membrane protein YoaT (DUF817 family)
MDPLLNYYWYPVRDVLAWSLVVLQLGGVILTVYYRSVSARMWTVSTSLFLMALITFVNRFAATYYSSRQYFGLRDLLWSVTVIGSVVAWGLLLVGLALVLCDLRKFVPRHAYPNESWEP